MRRAAKRDTAEQPIIMALERTGWHVWQLDYPVDLLCWKANRGLRLLEVKTGRGSKLIVSPDKRQVAQRAFLEITGCPVVRTPIEALQALGEVS